MGSREKMWKRAAQAVLTVLFAALLAMLAFAIYKNYDAYTRMMMAQQQQHLLITARAVSQNLSLYLSEQMRDIDILTKTPGFLEKLEQYRSNGETRGLKEYVLSYMLSQERGLSRIYLLNESGQELFHYSQYPFLELFDEKLLHLSELAEQRQSGPGTTFRIDEHHYGLTMVNKIIDGNDYVGTVVSVLDMEKLYQNFVEPLEQQGVGDIIVQNAKGTVIMHPNSAMLGFNSFRMIEGIDTLPQYKSQFEMLREQYSCEEGTARYRFFSGGIQPPREEIASFSRMNLEGTIWYVSAVMPYSEITRLVRENLGRFGMLIAAVLIVVAAAVLAIYAVQKDKQKLELKARYLKEINRTLEELQESREQLQHYQKLQTVGTLASGIVHEFNNLLIPILGYSEFLKKQLGTKNEYYEDIDEIYHAGMRAKEVVEQILPFSRRETDAKSYGPVSLEVVLRDVLKTIQILLPGNVELQQEALAWHMSVFGSATQLHQVFLNLCSNAVQAMERDGGRLCLRAEKLSEAQLPEEFHPVVRGDYVMVTVSDTGCGISGKDLPYIFDPFFTTKAEGEGTGLGLSVVHEILISHKGFIAVRSERGQGSCFYVYLPLCLSEGVDKN